MTDRDPVETTNLDRYGFAELPWSRPREILGAGSLGPDTTHFLGTMRPDGRPHAAGIGAIWLDGDLYFTSGAGTRKARNLAANPACTISARLEGIDLVFEGDATRVTDAALVERAAAVFREGGWPAEVQGDEFIGPFSAPSAGPPHPGISTASRSTPSSVSPPQSRTARRAGVSHADGSGPVTATPWRARGEVPRTPIRSVPVVSGPVNNRRCRESARGS